MQCMENARKTNVHNKNLAAGDGGVPWAAVNAHRLFVR